jgi:hypothetical protein
MAMPRVHVGVADRVHVCVHVRIHVCDIVDVSFYFYVIFIVNSIHVHGIYLFLFMEYTYCSLNIFIKYRMFIQHDHAACLRSMFMQHGRSVCSCSMDILRGHAAWTCSMKIHYHVARTGTCTCHMYMQHMHATWICTMLMHHVHCTMSIAQCSCSICSYVASTCSMDMNMQNGQAYYCCMDMQAHAAWPGSMDFQN